MEPPDHLSSSTAERTWIIEGPNSGGVSGWHLWRGHLFAFANGFGYADVDPGIPVAEFLNRYKNKQEGRLQQMIDELREMAD